MGDIPARGMVTSLIESHHPLSSPQRVITMPEEVKEIDPKLATRNVLPDEALYEVAKIMQETMGLTMPASAIMETLKANESFFLAACGYHAWMHKWNIPIGVEYATTASSPAIGTEVP